MSLSTSDDPNTVIAKTAMIVLENSKGSLLPFTSAVLVNPTVSASSTEFRAAWQVNGADKGKYKDTAVANMILKVTFSETALPKISSEFSKVTYQLDKNCVPAPGQPCALGTYWSDAGFKDFQIYWNIMPSSGFDTFNSVDFGTVTVSSLSSGLNGAVASTGHSKAEFSGKKTWYVDWSEKGSKKFKLTTANVLTGSSAILIPFDLNDGSIDPTFGVTSTGSTSYPTSTFGYTTVGNGQESTNYLIMSKKTLSVPGTIQSISIYSLYSTTVKVGIYDDSSGSPNNLVAGPYEASVLSVQWNTITFTTPYYAVAGNYWLAFNTGANGGVAYKSGTTSATLRYKSLAYANSWPNPAGSGWSSGIYEESIYATYVQIEGYTKGTRVQFTGSTGSIVSAFYFYTHTGSASDHFTLAFYSDNAGSPNQLLWYSGSTDSASTTWNSVARTSGTLANGWDGSLTQNNYYWFMWQWDNVNSGPSYASGGANTGIYLAQAYGTLSSTWSGGTLSTENWSMYLGINSGPTNDACTLEAGSIASGVVGAAKEFTIRSQHTDADGATDVSYVRLTVDVAGWNAVFNWTRSSDAFAEQSDPSSYFTISSTSADSSSAGNQWTLDWRLTVTSWSTDEESKSIRLYVIDSISVSDQDDYSSVFRVENDLTSASLASNDYLVVPSQTVTLSGYWYYEGTTVAPPDDNYNVVIKLSGAAKGTDPTLVSGVFSVSITCEEAYGSYYYTVEVDHMTTAGTFPEIVVGTVTTTVTYSTTTTSVSTSVTVTSTTETETTTSIATTITSMTTQTTSMTITSTSTTILTNMPLGGAATAAPQQVGISVSAVPMIVDQTQTVVSEVTVKPIGTGTFKITGVEFSKDKYGNELTWITLNDEMTPECDCYGVITSFTPGTLHIRISPGADVQATVWSVGILVRVLSSTGLSVSDDTNLIITVRGPATQTLQVAQTYPYQQEVTFVATGATALASVVGLAYTIKGKRAYGTRVATQSSW